MTPREASKDRDQISSEARALARDMARDSLEFTRVAWKLGSQMARLAARAAEDMAAEAERTWERQRPGKSREK